MIGFVLAGAGLRLWNLRGQILGGDELHAVRAVVEKPLAEILTTYSTTDYSLPLAALWRLLLEQGATLSELDFRLPSILCGLAALIALPRAVSGKVDRFSVDLFGWLVAFSPGLILYSRIARSYMPMVLAGFLAVMAFESWWRTRERRAGIAYVLFGAIAIWLHLGAAPLIAAPFLFAVGDLLWTREEVGRRLRDLVLLGLGLSLACAAFLVPARASLLALVSEKHQAQRVPLATLVEVLQLQAGTPSWTMATLFWLAALIGLGMLLRKHPRLGIYTLTVAAGHLAGLFLLSPVGIDHPNVLNRYLLPALPFFLLWVAMALSHRWSMRSGILGRGLQKSAARFFILFVFWTGPFLAEGYRKSSFMHHNDFVGFFAPRATIPAAALPPVYRQLPRGPVLEFPWSPTWEANRVFYIYQQVHGRRVLVSALDGMPRHPGLDFRNEAEPAPAAFLASPARTLVVHVRLPAEEDVVTASGRRLRRPMRADRRRYYRRAGERLANQLTREWGPPDQSDSLVRVWDLERVRSRTP